ncbi:efflux RND transporter periplasmic adaptor subunit [Algoriphagus sp. H41]|uniref:Efflux RND transporter periplasmic adaptor subunit n=1 Tax=Algoriphagus oliviformis TaxID=2811231 RepID=A0ABS3C643_9BACT|nr:efflux RND transporter periplasmic adaptor subunit [Algoriphagus oliviformis]MBN7812577.1 efflux RND transporter periplasmic adaptor subunit [Algoriphagus oliviformis]
MFLVLLLGFSCGKPESEVITPHRQSLTESVYASGIIKARDQYEAFTLASGPIQEIFVEEGDTVRAGEPILKVFSEREALSRENAQLSQAYADQQANQSKLRDLELATDLAKSKMVNDSLLLSRQRKLWSQNIGSAVELEQRELAYQNSKTAYESYLLRHRDLRREIEFNSKSASKNLAISKVVEGDYTLRSKIDGVVFSILKEKGEMVSPQTPLAVIGSAAEFLLELRVDEYDISKVELGQVALVTMDSFKEEVFEAKVTRIYPIMDPQSKSFTVEAVFTLSPPKLFPNLTLEANIVTSENPSALVIPRSYLWMDKSVLTEDGDTLPVKVGLKNFQFAEILEGADEQTRIIPPGQ